jgi:type IV secretion system protein VirB10
VYKRQVSRERQAELPYIKTTLISPISQYEIKAGTILPATLITGINSDLPGQIVAQLRENVYDTVTGNYLLIPQGTRLIGEYDSKVAFGQERVLVIWTRLILPNGSSIGLEGMPGIDLSGYAGMTGKVNNHYGKLITGVVLGSVIGAGAQVAVGGQGAPNVPPSFGQLAVSGAAQNINQTAQRHTDKVLNMQPTIEVTPGDKINVFVTKDMILKPFNE